MPEKVKGTVKWFSNKKGFGFVTPVEGENDVFLHHSKIVSDAEYKTLRDGFEVEFEIGTDENGKPFADHVTSADGSPCPAREPQAGRRKGKKKEEGEEKSDDNAEDGKEGKPKGRRNQKKNGKKPARQNWFTELDDDVKKSLEDRSIKVEGGRAFVSIGDARVKLGTEGYAAMAHASGLVAEGTYTCSKDGQVAATWVSVLKHDGSEWKGSTTEEASDVLVTAIDLKDESVKASGADETPDGLWGEGKDDPRDALESNGFQMKKVALYHTASRRGPGRRNHRRKPQKKGEQKEAATQET